MIDTFSFVTGALVGAALTAAFLPAEARAQGVLQPKATVVVMQPQGFGSMADSADACFTWNGGHKSAGSFSRCQGAQALTVAVNVPAHLPVATPVCPMPEPAKPRPVVKRKPVPPKC